MENLIVYYIIKFLPFNVPHDLGYDVLGGNSTYISIDYTQIDLTSFNLKLDVCIEKQDKNMWCKFM